MKYLYSLLDKLLKTLGLKAESNEEIAEKLSIRFLRQFDMGKDDKAYYKFILSVFLEYGKNKKELEEVYELLNKGYVILARFLKSDEESPKLVDEYAYLGEPDKYKILRILRIVISKAKDRRTFEKILVSLSNEALMNNHQPSLIINVIIPLVLEHSLERDMENDIILLAKISQLYIDLIEKDTSSFTERILSIYLDIKTKHDNINMETFAEKTIQDISNMINSFTKEREDFNGNKQIEYKETSKIILNRIFPAYIVYHVYNYGNYQEEFKDFFYALLTNILKRYGKDEALLQAVLINLSYILSLSATPNIMVDYIKIIDGFITDFIEIGKLPIVEESISKNGMHLFASQKMKKDITSSESLLINYVAFAIPRIVEICGPRLDLLSVSRKLVKDLMESYNDVEIGFYYLYAVLHRWLKVYKSEVKIKDLHNKLKKLLYAKKSNYNHNELVRFFYFDFKDGMIIDPTTAMQTSTQSN